MDAGGVHGDEHHGLLAVRGGGGVCPAHVSAHEDGDFAAWVAGAGGPPLAAVEDVVIALAADGGLDVGGVGGGDGGLGHAEAGADFTGEQGLEPALVVLGGAVAGEHFHVAGVGRGAVEDFGGDVAAAHGLAEGGVLEVGQALAAVEAGGDGAVRREEEVPETFGAGFGFEVFEDLGGLPAVARYFVVEDGFGGVDVLVHEALELRVEELDSSGGFQVDRHDGFPRPMVQKGGGWVSKGAFGVVSGAERVAGAESRISETRFGAPGLCCSML